MEEVSMKSDGNDVFVVCRDRPLYLRLQASSQEAIDSESPSCLFKLLICNKKLPAPENCL